MFIQSARAESVTHQGSAEIPTVGVVWGLTIVYEHLDCDVLWDRAEASELPLVLLTVITNQYQSKRFVSFQDMCMFVSYAHFGLPAGCSYATYLIQAYTLTSFEVVPA